MKIRGLIIASVVFFALAGTLYWSEHRKSTETPSKTSADTPPSILKLDEQSITKLDIKKKDSESLGLVKMASGTWQITAPKPFGADQSAVTGILSTLSSLDSQRLVEEKATDLKPYGLDQPALQVDITTKDKAQSLKIGDDTPTGSAVYAMVAGDPRVFTMASYAKTSVDKGLNDLRDKRLLTIDSDKINQVQLAKGKDVIEFGRTKDGWQILRPLPSRADGFQVDELVRKLTDAKMDLSTTDSKDTATGFASAKPLAIARVTGQSGTQELQVRKNSDNYYAKSSAVDGAYKVTSDLGQAIDKGLDDFRNKKVFDFGFSDPNKIELHDGNKAYFLTRSGEDWWSNGKKMDPSSVQPFAAKLRDLTADKFPTSGFAGPVIEVTVSSDDGKRTEKISIAKAADGYIAKRDNEPALYQLSSSSIDDLRKAAEEVKELKPTAKPSK